MDDVWAVPSEEDIPEFEDVPESYEQYSIYKNVRPDGNYIKIQVIKEIRSVLRIGLKEAKDITDIMDATGSGVLTHMTKRHALCLVKLGFTANDIYGNPVTENYLPDELFVID